MVERYVPLAILPPSIFEKILDRSNSILDRFFESAIHDRGDCSAYFSIESRAVPYLPGHDFGSRPMAVVNRIRKLLTHEGAQSATISVRAQLERSVMSCLLWEDEFYESGVTIARRIAELVWQLPAAEVAAIAIRAKEEMRLRHVPLLLAREMLRSQDGRQQFGALASRLFTRPDDIAEFLAIYWKDLPKEPLAKQAKVHVGNALRRFDEYQLAKYNGGSRKIKLRDVIRITRPKPENAEQAELWRKLVKGELATPDTWEVELSKGGDKRTSWERLLREEKLGGLAMLRNIRNMREAKVSKDLIKGGIKRIKAGKLLPINFIAAARHNPTFESALETKFLECFSGNKKYDGETVILIDVSGSMDARLSQKSELTRIDVACSLAIIGRELFKDLRVFTFSSDVVEVPTRRGFSLGDAVTKSQPHCSTELGKAVAKMPKCDRLIVITDEQSHDAVPNRSGYLINVASSKNGVGYGKWIHIDGWSDKVLDYIVRLEQMEVE